MSDGRQPHPQPHGSQFERRPFGWTPSPIYHKRRCALLAVSNIVCFLCVCFCYPLLVWFGWVAANLYPRLHEHDQDLLGSDQWACHCQLRTISSSLGRSTEGIVLMTRPRQQPIDNDLAVLLPLPENSSIDVTGRRSTPSIACGTNAKRCVPSTHHTTCTGGKHE